ncbi:unnamed protein product [Sphacelaria rigidula]
MLQSLASWRRASTALNMVTKPFQLEADASFEDVVLKSELPVLVDFHASWCAPCKLLAPVMDSLADAYDGTLKVVKIDCDTHKDLMNNYKARGLPMMAVFNEGQLLKRKEGLLEFDEVGEMLAKLVPGFKTVPEP